MSASKLDAVYRSILLTKFFTKGWGKPENLRRLFEFRKVVSDRNECFKLVERDYPVTITKEQNLNDCKVIEGHFMSPLERYLPGIVPEIAQKAHFQVLLPMHWREKDVKPVCLHLAGTGDHFFWRRRNLMVKPLLKEAGIGGIILENPFYGLRKPVDQVRSSLHNVSDIFVMGGCLILESLVLFHWCERNGLGPLGVTGLSMGGHMASLAATNWPKPLVLVPCLSWSTASAVFLQGVMSQSINWDLLEDQYMSDGVYREKLSKMVTIIDEAFLAGKKFARTYSDISTIPNAIEDKNVDITYKENRVGRKDLEVDVKVNPKAELNCNRVVNVSKNVEINKVLNETKSDLEMLSDRIVDVSKDLEMKAKVLNETKSELAIHIETLYAELRKLLDEDKISKELYDKLVSKETFALKPGDIKDLNKLTEDGLKEVLLRCKLAFLKQEDAVNSQQTEKDDKNSKTQKEIVEYKTSLPEKVEPLSKANLIVQKPKEKSSWSISEIASDWINLPFLRSERKIDINKIHWRDREALQFMRGVMDECTHLSNFSVPFDTSLIIAVCARHDAYVPRDDVGTLEEIWPGAEVRYVDAGHVSAYILHQSMFRACIREAFERSKKKWKDGEHIV